MVDGEMGAEEEQLAWIIDICAWKQSLRWRLLIIGFFKIWDYCFGRFWEYLEIIQMVHL